MKPKVLALFILGILGVPPTANATETDQAPAPSDPAAGRVTRAQFTSAVKNLEPLDSLMALNNDKTRIAYFTEIQDMAGQTVIHRWEYNGKVMAEVPFKVGAARWRVYSTKTLDPSWVGEWKASVVDSAGSSLGVNTFSYTPATDSHSGHCDIVNARAVNNHRFHFGEAGARRAGAADGSTAAR